MEAVFQSGALRAGGEQCVGVGSLRVTPGPVLLFLFLSSGFLLLKGSCSCSAQDDEI